MLIERVSSGAYSQCISSVSKHHVHGRIGGTVSAVVTQACQLVHRARALVAYAANKS